MPAFRFIRHGLAASAVAMTVMAGSAVAAESAYPQRPIRLIVPSGAGGGYDVTARATAQALSQILRQPVVVENRVGAAGTIGAAQAARSAADGYTLFWGGNGPLTLSPYLFANAGYDPTTAFEPVSLGSTSAYALVVAGNAGIDSIEALADKARATPDGVTYASNGQNGGLHLLGEMLAEERGFAATHIPYKGGTEGVTAVMSGNVDYTFDAVSTTIPFVRDGRLKVLAVTGSERDAGYPDVPTTAELGMPALTSDIFFGLLAPAGLPADVKTTLRQAMHAALEQDAVRKTIVATGNQPRSSTPEVFGQIIDREAARWRQVLAAKNITPQ